MVLREYSFFGLGVRMLVFSWIRVFFLVVFFVFRVIICFLGYLGFCGYFFLFGEDFFLIWVLSFCGLFSGFVF